MPQVHLLVTTEWPGLPLCGGIGVAIRELAKGLVAIGESVSVLHVSHSGLSQEEQNACRLESQTWGFEFDSLKSSDHTWDSSVRALSYGAWRGVEKFAKRLSDETRLVVHFHDYLGVAFYSLAAKRTGMLSGDHLLILHAHGPTEWSRELNSRNCESHFELVQEFLERQCYVEADLVVSPSFYMREWLVNRGYCSDPEKVFPLQNLAEIRADRHIRDGADSRDSRAESFPEVIFLGRHEYRKGWKVVLEAVDLLNADERFRDIRVHLVGQFAVNQHVHSAYDLLTHARDWSINWQLHSDFSPDDVRKFLAERPDALVVIASYVENCPYVVIDAAAAGRYLVASRDGGSGELLADSQNLIEMTPSNLIEAIERYLSGQIPRATLRKARSEQLEDLAELVSRITTHTKEADISSLPTDSDISLSVVITHFRRPARLFEALIAFMNQTDSEFEMIIVDDKSDLEVSDVWWSRCIRLADSLGWRILVRSSNGYLGAARNSGWRAATGSHVLFFDDDDVPSPELVLRVKQALKISESDFVVPFAVSVENHPDRLTSSEWMALSKDAKPNYLPTRNSNTFLFRVPI